MAGSAGALPSLKEKERVRPAAVRRHRCPAEEKNTREKAMSRSHKGTVGDVFRARERRGAWFSP